MKYLRMDKVIQPTLSHEKVLWQRKVNVSTCDQPGSDRPKGDC